MYQSIVIGAGIAGAVVARELAEKGDQKVLVVEQRNHVAGNCYDREDEHGILIHQYGPHIFHTPMEEVYQYLSRFTSWHLFGHEVVANVHGKLLPVPFNLNTLSLVYGAEKANCLESKLIAAYGEDARVPILELRKHKNQEVRDIADFVYENIFLKYTMKQWGQTPEEIDPMVTARVPVVVSRDNRYFRDPYQGVPKEGFTKMFEKMLDHPNITLKLNLDALDVIQITGKEIFFNGELFDGNIVFTGPVDELFHCKYGRLPYRSLRFDFEHHACDSYQGHSVVNYTVSEEFTRITEFKFLTGQEAKGHTTIVKEVPFAYEGKEGEIPYYAIISSENRSLYEKYLGLLKGLKNFYLVGRLAEYQYYNIDAMVKKALELSKQLI